jgi:hypothetical protein
MRTITLEEHYATPAFMDGPGHQINEEAEAARTHPRVAAGLTRPIEQLGVPLYLHPTPPSTSSGSSSAGPWTGTRACSWWSATWARPSRSCCPDSNEPCPRS